MSGFAHIEVRPNGDVVLVDSFSGVSGGGGTGGGSGTVDESDISLYDVTTDNATTGRHGFLKKLSGNANEYMDGTGNWSVPSFVFTGSITEAQISLSDVTTDDATTGRHGFLKKLSGNSGEYMDGSGNWSVPPTGVVSTVTEAQISLSDVTTDNVSTTKHGFAPKAPNDAGKFLDGTGAYSRPIRSLNVVFGGAGSVISTGVSGDVNIDFDCTITKWTILADVTGSIQVDIWKDTYANYPPTSADKITGTLVPSISSGIKNQDSTLTGWTNAITAGDILRFNVTSAATITRATLCLELV